MQHRERVDVEVPRLDRRILRRDLAEHALPERVPLRIALLLSAMQTRRRPCARANSKAARMIRSTPL